MINKESCCGCSACKIACPTQCIKMKYDDEGFIYPVIDYSKCINCGLCEKVCPFKQIEVVKNAPTVFGAYCLDDSIREKSSSGGIFSVLAMNVLEKKGIVCGAIFNSETKKVNHICISDINQLGVLQGSKYIQSEMGNVYSEVKQYLCQEKLVLFSGTSCQVAGLKTYLGKDYDNLYSVELICHGVPSTKLWEKYCENVENKTNKTIHDVKFRSKKYNWSNYGIITEYGDNKKSFNFHYENSFFRLFNSNICLRPSCYDCKVKGFNTKADISLGDFWNVENIYPNLDVTKGVSLVLLCTEKGKRLFYECKNKIVTFDEKLNYQIACDCNHAINTSMKESKLRKEFFDDLNTISYDEIVKKYSPISTKIMIKGFFLRLGIWNILSKIRK